jgi:3-phenylpropionate/trans-cinnamate dioxygenase ferredoxin subunit
MLTHLVCRSDELAIGQMKAFAVGGEKIVLYHLTDGFFATQASCTHVFAPLSRGKLIADSISQCPFHRARFDIRTGQVGDWANFPPGIQLLNGAVASGVIGHAGRQPPATTPELAIYFVAKCMWDIRRFHWPSLFLPRAIAMGQKFWWDRTSGNHGPGDQSAIDQVARAVDVRGCITCKEGNDFGNLLRLGEALQRDLVLPGTLEGRCHG